MLWSPRATQAWSNRSSCRPVNRNSRNCNVFPNRLSATSCNGRADSEEVCSTGLTKIVGQFDPYPLFIWQLLHAPFPSRPRSRWLAVLDLNDTDVPDRNRRETARLKPRWGKGAKYFFTKSGYVIRRSSLYRARSMGERVDFARRVARYCSFSFAQSVGFPVDPSCRAAQTVQTRPGPRPNQISCLKGIGCRRRLPTGVHGQWAQPVRKETATKIWITTRAA